jgi:hypothetical protein
VTGADEVEQFRSVEAADQVRDMILKSPAGTDSASKETTRFVRESGRF